MNTPRTRILAISGATLALIVAGTAVVSAHPGGDRGDRGDRGQRGQFGERFERRGGGFRAEIRQGIRGQIDDFVRRETIVQTEDGTSTRRVDNGTLTSTSETSVSYTLSTGERVEVTIDEETNAVAFAAPEEGQNEGRRRFRGPRLRPTEVAVTEIAADSQVVVWSQSQDDGSFLAQRIVVQPDLEAATDGDASVDAADLDTVTLDAPAPVAA